jgi:hypothetical protein
LPVTSIAEFGDFLLVLSKNFFESTPSRSKKLDIPKTDAMSPGHKASTGVSQGFAGARISLGRMVRFPVMEEAKLSNSGLHDSGDNRRMQRITLVYPDRREYRVYAPSRASGDPVQWKSQLAAWPRWRTIDAGSPTAAT